MTHLAVEGRVSTATQNQALNALVFLYKHVLKMERGEGSINALRAKRSNRNRLPVVLTKEELRAMVGEYGLMGRLLYGCGLRVASADC